MNTIAFLSYIVVTSITPGPSNILMMNEARKEGFAGAWRFSSGILTGFALLGILSVLFTSNIYQWMPMIEPYLKALGVGYLLYLAWKVSRPSSASATAQPGRSSFWAGLLVQLLNIKSILFFLTVMSAFIIPLAGSILAIVGYVIITVLLGWGALLLWSLCGSMFQTFFVKYDRPVRMGMSGLLIYAAIVVFL